jgi:hypothetical protein
LRDRVDLQRRRSIPEIRDDFGESKGIFMPREFGRPFFGGRATLPKRCKTMLEFALGVSFATAESDCFELARDIVAMQVESSRKRIPVRVAHGDAQALAVGVVPGQIVRLLVAHRLDEVFESPQEHVGITQPRHRCTFQPPATLERSAAISAYISRSDSNTP